jgi:hypothetical protein
MSALVQSIEEDNKAQWKLFFDYILAGGVANGQKAFDTLCAIGHSEVVANSHPEEVATTTPVLKTNPPNQEFADPMTLNKCAHCDKRGHYSGMFVCDGCENCFHPGCVSENPPRDDKNPRFEDYLCPMCISRRHLFPPYSLD